MSKAPTAPATSPPTTQPVKEPAKTSPLRLGILLGILVVAILMVIHHYAYAQPSTQAAYDKIDEEFRKQNAKGVTNDSGKIDAGLLSPKDVREILGGKQPWSATESPDELVEYYWWYGLPDRNYVSVKYVGKKGAWRFDTHYLNQKPPKDDAPDVNNSPPVQTPPTTGETGSGDKTPPPPGPPGPNTEAPSDKPSDDKSSEDKPAGDKPATPSEESK